MNSLNKLFNKIKNNNGESLVETLVSMVIVSMGMIIMAGAIMSAASTAVKTKKNYLSSQDAFEDPVKVSSTIRLTMDNGSGGTNISNVTTYQFKETENDNYFYYWHFNK